jgi:tetratricopeptide (TPR) repeat protein
LVSRPSARASDKSALADAYGSRSWLDLLLGQFDQAVNDAETGFSYDGKKLWILTNKAHGLLFLGKQEPALEIYRDNAKRLAYPELNDIKTTFGEAVLDDFAKFRKAPRLNVPALDEAEKTVRAAMAGGGSPAKNDPQ